MDSMSRKELLIKCGIICRKRHSPINEIFLCVLPYLLSRGPLTHSGRVSAKESRSFSVENFGGFSERKGSGDGASGIENEDRFAVFGWLLVAGGMG